MESIPNIITDLAFPIFAAAYLLVVVTKKLDRMILELLLIKIYVALLLSKSGVAIPDPQLNAILAQYLATTKKKETE